MQKIIYKKVVVKTAFMIHLQFSEALFPIQSIVYLHNRWIPTMMMILFDSTLSINMRSEFTNKKNSINIDKIILFSYR